MGRSEKVQNYADVIYGWSLSPTVHMLFVHGSDILRESPLAPGFLSGQFYLISVIQAIFNEINAIK